MISSNPLKVFLTVLIAFAIAGSCRSWSTPADAPSELNPPGQLKSRIPFATKEPAVFQAEIVITTIANGESSVRTILTARNGIRFRNDYPGGASFLQVSERERFLLNSEKKIFAKSPNAGNESGRPGDELKDLLTTQWLNEKRDAKFEDLGTENGLKKYRATLDESVDSEILIYVDENLKIPVRQEFYIVGGDQKTLVYSMELKNVRLEADEKLFSILQDFKEVSPEEFQKTSRKD